MFKCEKPASFTVSGKLVIVIILIMVDFRFNSTGTNQKKNPEHMDVGLVRGILENWPIFQKM